MGGFIIVDDKHGLRSEMHERMSGKRVSHRMTDRRDYEEGYREGYEHGYRDHEHDTDVHGEWKDTRYGR